jgi:hypothetical protein
VQSISDSRLCSSNVSSSTKVYATACDCVLQLQAWCYHCYCCCCWHYQYCDSTTTTLVIKIVRYCCHYHTLLSLLLLLQQWIFVIACIIKLFALFYLCYKAYLPFYRIVVNNKFVQGAQEVSSSLTKSLPSTAAGSVSDSVPGTPAGSCQRSPTAGGNRSTRFLKAFSSAAAEKSKSRGST